MPSQIVYDVYELGKIMTTYQSAGKAKAAAARLGAFAVVKRRDVVHGQSPRWAKPKQRPMLMAGTEIALATVLGRFLAR